MQDRKNLKRRMMLWAVAGALGAGVPTLVPSAAMAQEEQKAVEESRVPPAVVSTARSTYLDGRDVVYRKDGNRYVMNWTTPQNVRLQTAFNEDGSVAREIRLAPSQPENAPRREERERIVTEWTARVAQVKATPVRPGVPANPLPREIGALPPGELPPLPVTPVNTPMTAADLPAGVVQSFDRFTTGARDIRYYRQTADGRSRYEAHYTHPDGTRREVVVADNGSLMAGPMVLREQVADTDLVADRPENQQPADTRRIEAQDVPPRARQIMDRYTQRATDVRYRRDTYADRSIAYTVHWVQPDNGRRYFTTVREDGQIAVAPRLSNFQPDATTDEEGVRSGRVAWRDVPDRVKQTLEPLTRNDRNAAYYRQVRDGNKIFYGAEYQDNGRLTWVRVDETGRTVAGPIAARGGEATAGRDRAAQPAAGRVPADVRSEKVNFATMPKVVQDRVLREGREGKDFVNTRLTADGRTVYHSTWTDRDGRQQELWQNERGETVQAPRPAR